MHDESTIKQYIESKFGDFDVATKIKLERLLAGKEEVERHQVKSAGRSGLQSGKVSELTVIAPLKPGGADKLRRIFHELGGNFFGVTKIGTVHDMRFVFLENDTKLLFASTYDGDWDSYIDDFAGKLADAMDILFGNLEGWPGVHDPHVKDAMLRYQVTASAWYVATPELSVQEVEKARKLMTGLETLLQEVSE